MSVVDPVVLTRELIRAPSVTPADAGAMAGFQMIVHPSNPATTVDRRFVGDAFLKKFGDPSGG